MQKGYTAAKILPSARGLPSLGALSELFVFLVVSEAAAFNFDAPVCAHSERCQPLQLRVLVFLPMKR
jgi:hypothetical protein